MIAVRAAKRYAQALYEAAEARGVLERVAADMASVSRLLPEAPELQRFLTLPGISRARRLAVITAVFRGRVDDLTWRLLVLLEQKHRSNVWASVCRDFQLLWEKGRGIRRARVETAFDLDPDLTGLVEGFAARLAGGPVALESVRKPELLGGLRIRIGDWIYDYSLAGELAALQAALYSAGRQESRHAA